MNLAQKYAQMGARQNIIQEGINDLLAIQQQLAADKGGMKFWGDTAVLSNIVLVPLNCIVNAFELGTVNTAYQTIVKLVYERFAKSGTRAEGSTKTAIGALKKAVVEALKSKGLKSAVPGANILFGLTEDTLAAYQAMEMAEAGRREGAALSATIAANIARMVKELESLGVMRAQLLDALRRQARTA